MFEFYFTSLNINVKIIMVIYMRVISGELKGRIIKGFTLEGTRPTMDRVKESIFSSIQLKVPNSICLDLFAGSGSLGIEAISNGASKCYFVDCNKEAIKVLNENINNFNINSNTIIIKNDYLQALNDFKNKNIKFDIIFLDPPYMLHVLNDVLKFISNNNLLCDDGVVICEVDNNYLEQEIGNLIQYKDKKYGTTFVYYYAKK